MRSLLPPIVMSSGINESLDLPNEIWLYILTIAVETVEWPVYAFFPPPDDLACLRGIKAVSRRFRDLAECVERLGPFRSVSVEHLKNLVQRPIPADHVRSAILRFHRNNPTLAYFDSQ